MFWLFCTATRIIYSYSEGRTCIQKKIRNWKNILVGTLVKRSNFHILSGNKIQNVFRIYKYFKLNEEKKIVSCLEDIMKVVKFQQPREQFLTSRQLLRVTKRHNRHVRIKQWSIQNKDKFNEIWTLNVNTSPKNRSALESQIKWVDTGYFRNKWCTQIW